MIFFFQFRPVSLHHHRRVAGNLLSCVSWLQSWHWTLTRLKVDMRAPLFMDTFCKTLDWSSPNPSQPISIYRTRWKKCHLPLITHYTTNTYRCVCVCHRRWAAEHQTPQPEPKKILQGDYLDGFALEKILLREVLNKQLGMSDET